MFWKLFIDDIKNNISNNWYSLKIKEIESEWLNFNLSILFPTITIKKVENFV